MSIIIETACKNLTSAAQRYVTGMDEEKCKVVNYGLQVLFSDVLKMAVMLVIAHLLGILSYTLIAMVSFGTVRSFAGGVHAKTWLGCLIANSIMFYGIVYLAIFISKTGMTLPCTLTILPVCVWIACLYAPSDHITKPVVSKKQRKRFKIITLISLLMIFILSIIWVNQPVSGIITLSALAASIIILPVTYKLSNNSYGSICR